VCTAIDSIDLCVERNTEDTGRSAREILFLTARTLRRDWDESFGRQISEDFSIGSYVDASQLPLFVADGRDYQSIRTRYSSSLYEQKEGQS